MSNLNIIYPIKTFITTTIKSVFDRTYNQLPLNDVDYPFAVYEIELINYDLNILIDLWSNTGNLNEFNILADKLIDKLDRISVSNKSIHLSGEIELIRDIPTQEENLNRMQIICNYSVYKETII